MELIAQAVIDKVCHSLVRFGSAAIFKDYVIVPSPLDLHICFTCCVSVLLLQYKNVLYQNSNNIFTNPHTTVKVPILYKLENNCGRKRDKYEWKNLSDARFSYIRFYIQKLLLYYNLSIYSYIYIRACRFVSFWGFLDHYM